MKKFLKLAFILFIGLAILLHCCQTGFAVEEAHRPKIGLVLGGGGARGAAHLGVLKVIEANKVPIDFIVGTSMGAIVGGLYASGLSPEEIEQRINEIDWVDMFKDRPSEEYLSFRDKDDQQRLSSVEMGVKGGNLVLPRGVMAGQKLGFELKKLTIHTVGISDFDKLNIPFRAVATDLRTGELVVLKKGNLAEAMRASMSIPGVWPPVELDGRILVDGFLVSNVPVEIAKEIGADIIIAVDVVAPPSETEKFDTLIDVVSQMTTIFSRQNVDKSLALLGENDLLIHPKLKDIKPSSFTRMQDAITIGEESARALVDKIRRYTVTDGQFQKFLVKQRRQDFNTTVVDEIRITGLKRVSERSVRGKLDIKINQPLNLAQLKCDITQIYAMDDFERVDFRIVEENNNNVLVIDAKEKPWGPNFLRFGLNLSSDMSGDSEYTALVDFSMTQLNSLGAEWKNVLQMGETRGIFSEWYQPLDTQDYFFIAPSFKYERQLRDVYDGDRRIAEYETKYLGGGIGGGINFSSLAQARLDYFRAAIDAGPEVGGIDLLEFNGIQEGALNARLEYDQFDNHKFPKRGIDTFVNFYSSNKALGADFSYEKLEFGFAKATTFAYRHTLLSTLRFGTTLNQDAPFYDEFTLGGFLNLTGYGRQQLYGQHSGLGQALYYYKFAKDKYGSGGNIYLGGGLEFGNVWQKRSDIKARDLLWGGVLFVGVDSFLGPLYLGYGKTEGASEDRVYLYLGQTF